MADTVAVMRAGGVEQLGAPAQLYDKPANAFVANFLGQSNLLPFEITSVSGAVATVLSHGNELRVESASLPAGQTAGLSLGIRPEKLRLVTANDTTLTNRLSGEISDASFTGVSTTYLVRMPWGQELTVTQPNDGTARAVLGEQVTIAWDPHHAFVIGAD
jgi:spermidine/putrescine transport system ATP-binding protein